MIEATPATKTFGALPEAGSLRAQVLDALRSFGEKTLTYRGREPGGSFLIVGGTHGNEILGILLADLFKRNLDQGTLALKAGTLRLLLGNPKAIEANERTIPGEEDLNRIMPAEVSPKPETIKAPKNGGYTKKRAQKIAKESSVSDITIDVHSTNRASPRFVCTRDTEKHRAVYRWLPSDFIVFDPKRIVTMGGRSIDEAADDMGNIGICYESGQATDTHNLVPVYEALLAILIEKGMIEGTLPEPPPSAPEYIVDVAIPYQSGYNFRFLENKIVGFTPVAKGEIIGYYESPGESKPFFSSVEGVIIFPKKPEHHESSGVVGYLAVK
jgi:succinylglutamate desuccinylase